LLVTVLACSQAAANIEIAMRSIAGISNDRDEAEIILLLEQALERLRRQQTPRNRAIRHLEEAIGCLRDRRESIHPSQLNSSNDG
jgi:hypothetical protein